MKLWNYMVMMTGIIVFLVLLGFNVGLDSLLNVVGIGTSNGQITSVDPSNSSFWSFIFNPTSGILVLIATGGAIIIGLFARSFDMRLVTLPIIIYISAQFVSTFAAIFIMASATGQSWLIGIIALIFAPISVGFIQAIIDYANGVD